MILPDRSHTAFQPESSKSRSRMKKPIPGMDVDTRACVFVADRDILETLLNTFKKVNLSTHRETVLGVNNATKNVWKSRHTISNLYDTKQVLYSSNFFCHVFLCIVMVKIVSLKKILVLFLDVVDGDFSSPFVG